MSVKTALKRVGSVMHAKVVRPVASVHIKRAEQLTTELNNLVADLQHKTLDLREYARQYREQQVDQVRGERAHG